MRMSKTTCKSVCATLVFAIWLTPLFAQAPNREALLAVIANTSSPWADVSSAYLALADLDPTETVGDVPAQVSHYELEYDKGMIKRNLA